MKVQAVEQDAEESRTSTESLYILGQIHALGIYACTSTNCDQTFKDHRKLKSHMQTHDSKKPYKCSSCNRCFRLNYHLKQHSKKAHDPNRKTFDCHLCNALFKTKNGLKSHIEGNIHNITKSSSSETSEKRLRVCTWENCNKTFKCKNGFKYHMRIHRNEKPFKCSYCVKSFRSKCHLQSHLLQKHDSRKPEYECHLCNSAFKTKPGLRQHLECHSKNMNTVPKKFYAESEKKFKCEICNKNFMLLKSLRNHQKLHTGENLYECTQCDKKFPEKHRLVRHSRVHETNKTLIEPENGQKDIQVEDVAQASINLTNDDSSDSHLSSFSIKDYKKQPRTKRQKTKVNYRESDDTDAERNNDRVKKTSDKNCKKKHNFECDWEDCGRFFVSYSDLISHSEIHMNSYPSNKLENKIANSVNSNSSELRSTISTEYLQKCYKIKTELEDNLIQNLKTEDGNQKIYTYQECDIDFRFNKPNKINACSTLHNSNGHQGCDIRWLDIPEKLWSCVFAGTINKT